MTLRRKTLLTIFVTLTSLIVLLYLVAESIILRSIYQSEEKSVQRDVQRALNVLGDSLNMIDRATTDWSVWDDTYDFIEDLNPDYIDSNLQPSSFTTLNINLLAYMRQGGDLAYYQAYDFEQGVEIAFPPRLIELLASEPSIWKNDQLDSRVGGIILLPEGPLMYSSRPILNSQGEGPIRGSLIMGRYITAQEIERLSLAANMELDIFPMDQFDSSGWNEAEVSELMAGTSFVVRSASPQIEEGYALLTDIYNNPALIMRIETGREAYQLGLTSIRAMFVALAWLGMVSILLTSLLLEKLVLSRLARLGQQVDLIGKQGDLSLQVSISGNDELSLLAKEINHTFAALDRSQTDLAESESRFRNLVENAPAVIYTTQCVPGSEALIDSLNPAFQTLTGWNREEWIGRIFSDLIHPEDRPLAREKSLEVVQHRTTVSYELRLLSQPGDDLICELTATPLLVSGQVVGELGIGRDITERKRAEDKLRRRANEQAVLHAVAVATTESVDEDMLIERATQVIGEILYPDQFGIMLVSSDGSYLYTHPSYRGITENAKQVTIHMGVGITGQTALEGRTIRIGDVRKAPMYINLTGPFICSEMCAPLKIGDRVIGVINAESNRVDAFSEMDERLFVTLAGQLATAIVRLRTEAAEKLQARQLATIYELGKGIIGASLDPEQVYIAIHQAVGKLMDSEVFVITLLDDVTQDLISVYSTDREGRFPPRRVPVESSLSGRVITTGEAVVIDDLPEGETKLSAVHFGTEESVRSVLAVPIRANAQVTGMLSAQSYRPNIYSTEDLHMLELLAAYAGIALGNARLYAETRRQALTFENMFDAVTLVNMQGEIIDWNQAAVRMFGFARAEVLGKPASMIYLPEDIPALPVRIDQGIQQDGRWSGEVGFVRKDGSRGISEVVVVPLRDDRGEIVATVGVNRDVSERKQAEQALVTSEARYRGLFEDSPISMWEEDYSGLKAYLDDLRQQGITDLSEYFKQHPGAMVVCASRIRVIDVNKTTLRMFKAGDKDELLSQIHSIRWPQAQDLFLKEMQAIWDGQVEFLGEGNYRDLEGNLISVYVHLLVPPGYEHSLSNVIISVMDVTARKQREHELEGVSQVSTALRVARNQREMMPVILNQLVDLVHAQVACLILRNPWDDRLTIEFGVGDWDEYTGAKFPAGDSITQHVISTGVPYFTESIQADSRYLGAGFVEKDYAVGVIPFVAMDQTIGAVWVGRSHPFSPAESRLLLAVADISANALYRSRLFEQSRQHVDQMIAVSRIGHELTETHAPDEIYIRLVSAIQGLLSDIATVVLSLYDKEEELLVSACALYDGQTMEAVQLPASHLEDWGFGSEQEAVQNRHLVRYGELSEEKKARLSRFIPGVHPGEIQSGLHLPLLSKGHLLGMLSVHSRFPHRFSESDCELLTLVANTAAVSIENARLFSETELRLRRLAALRTMDVAISSSFDLRVTLSVMLDQVTAQLGVHAADVLLYNSFTQTLDYSTGRGFRSNAITFTRIRLAEDLPGKAVLENKLVSARGNDQTVLRHPRLNGEDFITYFGVPLIAKGQIKGLLEIFHRSSLSTDPEWLDYLETLAGDTAIAIDSATLFNELQRSNTELMLAYDTTLEGWSRALELRDRETEGHAERVADLTVRLGKAVGMAESELVHLRRGALLHDIGKMGVPDNILLKAGELTREEREVMEQHPIYAHQMLSHIPYLRSALDIPYYHHERWDGKGYPNRLSGRQIPLAARVFAVIDVWDALRSDRPYRPAWEDKNALEYICTQSGAHFDPEVVDVFLRLVGPEIE